MYDFLGLNARQTLALALALSLLSKRQRLARAGGPTCACLGRFEGVGRGHGAGPRVLAVRDGPDHALRVGERHAGPPRAAAECDRGAQGGPRRRRRVVGAAGGAGAGGGAGLPAALRAQLRQPAARRPGRQRLDLPLDVARLPQAAPLPALRRDHDGGGVVLRPADPDDDPVQLRHHGVGLAPRPARHLEAGPPDGARAAPKNALSRASLVSRCCPPPHMWSASLGLRAPPWSARARLSRLARRSRLVLCARSHSPSRLSRLSPLSLPLTPHPPSCVLSLSLPLTFWTPLPTTTTTITNRCSTGSSSTSSPSSSP